MRMSDKDYLKQQIFFRRYQENVAVSSAFADLLRRYEPWDWWTTWTFRESYSAYSASKCFEAFMRGIESHAKYLYVVEANRYREGTHVHAVIGGINHLTYNQVADAWRLQYGRCHVVKYQGDQGVQLGQYLAKYMTKSACWWDLRIPGQLTLGLKARRGPRHERPGLGNPGRSPSVGQAARPEPGRYAPEGGILVRYRLSGEQHERASTRRASSRGFHRMRDLSPGEV